MKNKQKKSRPSLLSLCRCGGRVGRAACQPIWERTSSVEPPTADKSSLLGADFLLVHRPTWNSAATLKPFTVTSCSDNVSWRRLVSPRCSVLSSGHLAKTFLVFFPPNYPAPANVVWHLWLQPAVQNSNFAQRSWNWSTFLHVFIW